jgi:predicted flavoprotein YhiN
VVDRSLPNDPVALAALLKAVPVRLEGLVAIDRAISTAGGVSLDEVDDHYMLRRLPGTFVVGEMLDWEAPTGGFLLQATFATAVAAARGALAFQQ